MHGTYFTYISVHHLWLCIHWWTLVRKNKLDESILKHQVQNCNEEVQFKSNLYNDVGDLPSDEILTSTLDAFLKNML